MNTSTHQKKHKFTMIGSKTCANIAKDQLTARKIGIKEILTMLHKEGFSKLETN